MTSAWYSSWSMALLFLGSTHGWSTPLRNPYDFPAISKVMFLCLRRWVGFGGKKWRPVGGKRKLRKKWGKDCRYGDISPTRQRVSLRFASKKSRGHSDLRGFGAHFFVKWTCCSWGIWDLSIVSENHTRMNIICNMIVWYILLYYIYISQYILDIMMTSCEEVVSISEILPTTTLFNDWSEILICVWHIMSSPGIKTCIDSPRFTWISLLQLRPEKRPAAQTLLGIQVIQHLQAARLALCQIEKTNWPTTRLVKWCWKWHQSNWPQKKTTDLSKYVSTSWIFFPQVIDALDADGTNCFRGRTFGNSDLGRSRDPRRKTYRITTGNGKSII